MFLAQLQDSDTKRDWLDLLFPKLEATEKGQLVIQKMARSLADQTAFPDLANYEESAGMLAAAKSAVTLLREYLRQAEQESAETKDAVRRRAAAEDNRVRVQRSQADLGKLKERLDSLCLQIGTQQGGYAFQEWFYDLIDFFEVENRRPYISDGRQIDGSITIDGTTYLVELKFTAGQSGATDIDSIHKKVSGKADNTMGIMVSMSGFSSVAIQEASSAKSPLLLLEHSHLYMVLSAILTFPDTIRRIRRHSSQEGKAFLPVSEFGGK